VSSAPLTVSIVVPALNEEAQIGQTLGALVSVRGADEIIVVDGGSEDRTQEIARSYRVNVMVAARGRGLQMQAGAQASTGSLLWFVHADSLPSIESIEVLREVLNDPSVAGGNFRLRFDGASSSAKQLKVIYPLLRHVGLCYGDSGIFVRRVVFEAAGGFRPLRLFEDVDLVRRIKGHGRFVTAPCEMMTSSRRFDKRSAPAMWAQWIALQLLFWMGFHPNLLARWYSHVRR
jgi:rSAM/selenodomain-associated transferase 2